MARVPIERLMPKSDFRQWRSGADRALLFDAECYTINPEHQPLSIYFVGVLGRFTFISPIALLIATVNLASCTLSIRTASTCNVTAAACGPIRLRHYHTGSAAPITYLVALGFRAVALRDHLSYVISLHPSCTFSSRSPSASGVCARMRHSSRSRHQSPAAQTFRFEFWGDTQHG